MSFKRRTGRSAEETLEKERLTFVELNRIPTDIVIHTIHVQAMLSELYDETKEAAEVIDRLPAADGWIS